MLKRNAYSFLVYALCAIMMFTVGNKTVDVKWMTLAMFLVAELFTMGDITTAEEQIKHPEQTDEAVS